MQYSLLDTIASKIDDQQRLDFTYPEYEEALLFSKRQVGRMHGVLRRYMKKEIMLTALQGKTIEQLKEEPIKIGFPSFTNEYLVYVNKKQFTKRNENEVLSDNEYKIYPAFDGIYLNFSPRGETDVLEIFYEAVLNADDYDNALIEPVLSSNYDEELISSTIVNLAELGISRFKGDKRDKYVSLISYYTKKLNRSEVSSASKDIIEWPRLKIPRYL